MSEGRSRETVGLNLRPFKCGGGGDVRIPHNDKRLPNGQSPQGGFPVRIGGYQWFGGGSWVDLHLMV